MARCERWRKQVQHEAITWGRAVLSSDSPQNGNRDTELPVLEPRRASGGSSGNLVRDMKLSLVEPLFDPTVQEGGSAPPTYSGAPYHRT